MIDTETMILFIDWFELQQQQQQQQQQHQK